MVVDGLQNPGRYHEQLVRRDRKLCPTGGNLVPSVPAKIEVIVTVEEYLRDVLQVLIQRTREAKADYRAKRTQKGEEAAAFEAGRALGYYEVLMHATNQLR